MSWALAGFFLLVALGASYYIGAQAGARIVYENDARARERIWERLVDNKPELADLVVHHSRDLVLDLDRARRAGRRLGAYWKRRARG